MNTTLAGQVWSWFLIGVGMLLLTNVAGLRLTSDQNPDIAADISSDTVVVLPLELSGPQLDATEDVEPVPEPVVLQ